jgi:hypothetical protein
MHATVTITDIKGLRASIENFNRVHWVAMKRLWKNATKEFIRAAIFSGSVHIWTGMSAASFIPLARKAGIGRTVESFVIAKSKGARKGVTKMSGDYVSTEWKSIGQGIKAGEGAKLLFGSEKRPYMKFEFKINVYQYAYWESMWQSIDTGYFAFYNYISENYQKYFPHAAFQRAINPKTRTYHD